MSLVIIYGFHHLIMLVIIILIKLFILKNKLVFHRYLFKDTTFSHIINQDNEFKTIFKETAKIIDKNQNKLKIDFGRNEPCTFLKFQNFPQNIGIDELKKLLHGLWKVNFNSKSIKLKFFDHLSRDILPYADRDYHCEIFYSTKSEYKYWENWGIYKFRENIFLYITFFDVSKKIFQVKEIKKNSILFLHYYKDTIFEVEFVKQ